MLLAVGGSGLGVCVTPPVRVTPGATGKCPTLVWTRPQPARCGSGQPAARSPLAVGGAGLGECGAVFIWAVPGTAGKGPTLVSTRQRSAGSGTRQGSKRAARRRQSVARRARRSSPQGCGRNGRDGLTLVWTCQRSAGCGPLCGSRQQAARATLAVGGARLGECKAAPLWAVPGAPGKPGRGPTHVWTGPLPASCGSRQPAVRAPLAVGRAGLQEGKAAPLRAVPGATG